MTTWYLYVVLSLSSLPDKRKVSDSCNKGSSKGQRRRDWSGGWLPKKQGLVQPAPPSIPTLFWWDKFLVGCLFLASTISATFVYAWPMYDSEIGAALDHLTAKPFSDENHAFWWVAAYVSTRCRDGIALTLWWCQPSPWAVGNTESITNSQQYLNTWGTSPVLHCVQPWTLQLRVRDSATSKFVPRFI